MARKVQEFTIPSMEGSDGRDTGKTFVITEMSATQGEKWAIRALLALARNGADVPPEVLKLGFAGVAPYLINLVGAIRWEDAEPLLDEMLACVQFKAVVDSKGTPYLRKLVEADIEEIETLTLLRKEVVKLHKGFLIAAGRSILGSAAATPGAISPSA